MKIEFVNHASLIYDHDGIRLISDPWIEGRVFQNGWSHLSPSKFTYKDYDRITHIWFSHEHPDHFFPPNLKAIPEELRKRIIVLYPETKDRKVVEFCRKLNFKEVRELPPNREVVLSPDFKVINGPHGHDSWLYVRTSQCNLLNTNDCVTNTDASVAHIKGLIGPVDVLMTQFSYAGYAGNADEPEKRRESVRKKYEQMQRQINAFDPKYVIPTASFVWFCHEENFYMNDEINRIDRVADFMRQAKRKPVVLYPGDVWEYGSPHDSSSAIERYLADLQNTVVPTNTLKTQVTPVEELVKNSRKLIDQIRAQDKLCYALLIPFPLKVYLTDHKRSFVLSALSGLKPGTFSAEEAHMKVSSEAFDYCVKFNWGFETTMINGRFQVNRPSDISRIGYFLSVADSLNHSDSSLERIVSKAWRTAKAPFRRRKPQPA